MEFESTGTKEGGAVGVLDDEDGLLAEWEEAIATSDKVNNRARREMYSLMISIVIVRQ